MNNQDINFHLFEHLFCLHYNECDPKKCTAIKLRKLNLIRFIKKIDGKVKKAIILNPFSIKEISVKDKKDVINYGLVVIDCSWKRVLNDKFLQFEGNRKLPPLIAANPINYGKWEKLSSIEAIAAALYISSFSKEADFLLSKFSWGAQFKYLNDF